MGIDYTTYKSRDVLKDILRCVGFGALAEVYWTFALGLVSFVLNGRWHASWMQLVIYAGIAAAISMIFYIIHLVRKRKKEAEMRRFLHSKG